MENIDRFLIDELAKNNSRAFDKIFHNHYLNLCRFANSIVHDEDSAQSLVQQEFIRLWETRHSLQHVDHLIPYLTASVRNKCINYLKREKRNVEITTIPMNQLVDDITERQINLSEFEEKLLKALNNLSERCKMAFELSRFDELTHKEIAYRMGITEKGVEALITRSLKSLRKDLAEFLPSSNNTRAKNSTLLLLIRRIKGR